MMPGCRMIDIFSDKGRAALRNFIDRTTLLAFDLDGTLAPIVADPSGIAIPEEINLRMARLCRLAKVAVLTGRGRNDARRYLGFEPDYVIGNHGAEGLPGWEKRSEEFTRQCCEWEQQLRLFLPNSAEHGVTIENKGATLSLHYRNAPERDVAHREILEAIQRLEPQPISASGKCVVNIVPDGAPHKGEALLQIMQQAGFSTALFVGDDETDEDVFRLKNERIFGIRVGNEPSSAAAYCLSDQKKIVNLLDEITILFGALHG